MLIIIILCSLFCHSSLSDDSKELTIKDIDLLTATITDLQQALHSNQITSYNLVKSYLERIKKVNNELHAIIETNPDALDQASKLDQERNDNKDAKRSPLHGIPLLIKDNIATDDKMNTTSGSFALLGSKVPRDADVIYRLRKVGAIILGKTSMSEWSASRTTNQTREGWSARGGVSKSAYVENGDPCGSSSGSAIATSIGLCAAALGTETDGSIVCPSSRASLVGIKPTVGLTSRAGVIPVSHSQDSVGPMGKTVRDVALLLEAIQGIDPRDNATLNIDAVRPNNYTQFLLGTEGFKNMRLGVVRYGVFYNYTTSESDIMSEEQIQSANDAIELMKHYGAYIEDPANIQNIENINNGTSESVVLKTEFKQDIEVYLSKLQNTNIKTLADLIQFNNDNKQLEFTEYMPDHNLFEASENTTGYNSSKYTEALATNLRLGRTEGIDYTLDKYNLDALIMIGDGASSTAAIAQYPIISVPLGYLTENNGINKTLTGTPYGILFISRAWREDILLRVAHAFEQATH
ncbi:unnamed protein product, partial [Didymodactylos carnosus]